MVPLTLSVPVYVALLIALSFAQPTRTRSLQLLSFGTVLLLLAWIANFLGDLLLPFVVPLLLAYLLEPIMDLLRRVGVRRSFAILMVYGAVLGGVGLGGAVLYPKVAQQTTALLNQVSKAMHLAEERALAQAAVKREELKSLKETPPLPAIPDDPSPDNDTEAAAAARAAARIESTTGETWASLLDPTPTADWLKERLKYAPNLVKNVFGKQIERAIDERAQWWREKGAASFGHAITNAVKRTVITVGSLVWLLLVPIVLFYCLADFHPLRRRLWHMVPPDAREDVARVAGRINAAIGGWMRGYAVLCLTVAIVQTTNLLILQHYLHFEYGLLVGLAAGALFFIPYLGMLAGLALGTITIYLTGGHNLGHALIGLAVMESFYLVFDNLVAPRILGHNTGLHPMIVLFGILAGAKTFGAVGVLLATPTLVIVKIVLSYFYPRLSDEIPADEDVGPVPTRVPDAPPPAEPAGKDTT